MKIYNTIYSNIVYRLKIGGATKLIKFTESKYVSRIGTYATNKEDEIIAIETSAPFLRGEITLLEDTTPATTKAKAEATDNKHYPEVKSFTQAVKLLVEQYACNRKELPNKDALKAKIAELGVEFPNLKLND